MVSIVSAVSHLMAGHSVDLNLTQALSQYANYLAQGKEGSGYDISAALFGNIIYQRPNFQFTNCSEFTFQELIEEAKVNFLLFLTFLIRYSFFYRQRGCLLH